MKTYGILRLHKLNIVKITEQFTHRKIENCEILGVLCLRKGT